MIDERNQKKIKMKMKKIKDRNQMNTNNKPTN